MKNETVTLKSYVTCFKELTPVAHAHTNTHTDTLFLCINYCTDFKNCFTRIPINFHTKAVFNTFRRMTKLLNFSLFNCITIPIII